MKSIEFYFSQGNLKKHNLQTNVMYDDDDE